MVQPGDGSPAAARRPWSWWASHPATVGLCAAVGGTLLRWWVRRGNGPLVWNDSFDYMASAHTPFFSSDRWAGIRPGLMPSVLAWSRFHYRTFVTVQTVIAGIAWALLATAVAASLAPGWRRWLAAVAVMVVSSTWPVTMWDQQALTESLALSSLAILAAAVVYAAAGLDRRRAILLILAAIPALAVRDSHVIPVALAAVGLAMWELVARRVERRTLNRLPLLVAAYLLALAMVAAGSAEHGHRGRQPLEHVYAVRILPYPDRVEWFAAHGMPNGKDFATLPPVQTAGKADYTALMPLPQWKAWRTWLGREGRSTLLEFAITHPTYLWTEPERRPERVFNNGDGLPTYRPLRMRKVPLVDHVGYPDPVTVLSIALPSLVLASWRRAMRSPLVIGGAVLVATALPHALVVWHSDGMESARHLLIPATQARVGALFVVLGAVLAPKGPDPAEARRPARGRARAQRTAPPRSAVV